MKRLSVLLIVLFLFGCIGPELRPDDFMKAAEQTKGKVSELTEDTAPDSTDQAYTIDDPSGTPTSKKASWGNTITKAHGLSDGWVKVSSSTLTSSDSVDDLVTLSGVSEGATNLGTFTGSTITDDSATVKSALQELETSFEAGVGHSAVTLSTDIENNLMSISTQQLGLDNQTANWVFAGPSTGTPDVPDFRALVAGDIPDLSATYEVQLTNSAGLAGVLSDETGSGAAVFGTSPTIASPTITGTATVAGLDGSGTFSANLFTPDAQDGADIGSTSLEFSDVYLADGSIIKLGNDQDVTITHVADTGISVNLDVTATTFTIGSANIAEAELEILDGATLSTSDINIIDGISDSGSLTAAELLYVDGVTSAIQTQLDAKFATANIDDTPVNGVTDAPISSNWAYDHANGVDPHSVYMLESNIGTGANNYLKLGASPGTPTGSKYLRDDMTWATVSGSGDITGVGDCTSGDCLDGSSDGGEYIRLYDGDSNYAEFDVPNIAGDITITLPSATSTLATLASPDFTGSPTVATSIDPDAADGATLGSATKEWADAYFADGAVIYGQNDQSVSITSGASGWTLSGTTVVTNVDGSGTISGNLFTPDAADGAAIGSTDLEFSDIYLATGGVIYGEDDQSNTITSSAGGWTFSIFPITPSAAPDANYEVANKKYVDDTVGAAGGGDITAVGSYDSGNAFTDGAASTGTSMLVWEGTTVDDNEFTLIAPSADPGADINITFPSATGTLLNSDGVGTNLTALNGENIQNDTIDDDSIDLSTGDGLSAADMPDEDIGDITITGGAWAVEDDSHDHATTITGKAANVSDADFGEIVVSAGSWALDDDVVAAAEMADADHGMVSWSSGSATVEDFALNAAADAGDQNITSVAKLYGVDTDVQADDYIDLSTDDQITIVENDSTITINAGITISTGDGFTIGTTQWDDGSDHINGEVIADDTIDNDSIDWSDMTDLTTDGAVVWGNIAEGELTNDSIVEADLKVVDTPTDEDVLTYESTTGDFEWHSYSEIISGAKLDDLATPDDNTDLNATTTYHGLMPKLDNDNGHYLNGQGQWTTPAGSGDVSVSGTPLQYDFVYWNDATTIKGVNITPDSVICSDANGAPEACTNISDSATLASLAGLTETNGGLPYGTADNAYAWLSAGAEGTLLMGNGAGAPSWLASGTSGYMLVAAGAADPVWTAIGTVADNVGAAFTEGDIANDTILEADLKAVDAAADEDILTYESTTGDFEWHSADEIAGAITEIGANSIAASVSDWSVVDDFALADSGDFGGNDVTSANRIYGVDNDVALDLGDDGYTTLIADTGIESLGPYHLIGPDTSNYFKVAVDADGDTTVTIGGTTPTALFGAGSNEWGFNTSSWSINSDLSSGNATFNGTLTVGTSSVTLSSSGQVLTMAGTGGTYDENLTWDLDSATENQVDVGTGTGVTTVDFGTINLATDALDLSEGNITNGGDGAFDSISPDGATIEIGDVDEETHIQADGLPDSDDTYSCGMVLYLTAGNAVKQWDLVAMQTDGKVDMANASMNTVIGFAVEETNDGWPAADTETIGVCLLGSGGVIRNDGWTGHTAGEIVYVVDAGGTDGMFDPADEIDLEDGDHWIPVGVMQEEDIIIFPVPAWTTDNGS